MARRITADKTVVEYSQTTTSDRITADKAIVEYSLTTTKDRITATKLMVEYEPSPVSYRRVTSSKVMVEWAYPPYSPIKPYKKFLMSVADIYAYNSSGDLVLFGKTMLDTGIDLAISETMIPSGRGAATEFAYYSEPDLTIDIEDTQFNLAMLAATTGEDIGTGSDIYNEERVCLGVGGVGEVSKTPVANSYAWIVLPDGTYEKSAFTGNEFTSSASEGQCVDVVYITNEAAAQYLCIDGEIEPMEVYLILEATLAIGDRTYSEFGKIQIEIPKAILSGTFVLSMTPDGVSSTAISARALSYDTYSIETNYLPIYGYIKEIIPFRNWYDDIVSIIIANGNFDVSSTGTKQLIVRAIPSIGAAFTPPYSDLEFKTDNTAIATVDSSGLVSGVSAGQSGVRVRVKQRSEMVDVVLATVV